MNAEKIVAAIKLAMECIEDAARTAGPAGAPSGIVYAAMSSQGMTLNAYQQILAAMERAGKITVDGWHCIHIAGERAQ